MSSGKWLQASIHPVNNYYANKKIFDIFNSVYYMTMIIKQHKL